MYHLGQKNQCLHMLTHTNACKHTHTYAVSTGSHTVPGLPGESGSLSLSWGVSSLMKHVRRVLMEKVLGLVTPKLVASHDFIASIATPKSSRRPLADHPDAAIINFLLENLRCINPH